MRLKGTKVVEAEKKFCWLRRKDDLSKCIRAKKSGLLSVKLS